MYRQRNILLTLLLCIASVSVSVGQYQNFSQFNFSPDRINPGRYLKKDEAALRTAYRTANTNADLNLYTIYGSVSYPLSMFSSENSWSVLNFSVFNDATTQDGLFETTEINLGYNQMLQVGKTQTLSFGVSMRYNDKGINLRNYTTGSQFNPSLGFDPSIDIGENVNDFESRFYSVSAGIFLRGTDLIDKRYYMGLSLYDINRPNESVVEQESKLPITVQAEGGYHIYERGQYGIIPSFLYTRSGGTDLLNIGSAFQFKPDDFKTVELHTRYKIAKAIVLGLQYHTPNFSVGFSYDVPTGIRNDVFSNALEVAMELRKGIVSKKRLREKKEKKDKRKKQRKTKKPSDKHSAKKKKENNPIPKTDIAKMKDPLDGRAIIPNNLDTAQVAAPVQEDADYGTDSVKQHKDKDVAIDIGNIQTERKSITEQRLQVYFDFNSTSLNSDTKKALRQWAMALNNEEMLKLIIIGHTDNIGSREINQQLSLKRANVIKDYLVGQGADASKIVTKGEGMLKPAYGNNNAIGRSKNRRVELVLIKAN